MVGQKLRFSVPDVCFHWKDKILSETFPMYKINTRATGLYCFFWVIFVVVVARREKFERSWT